jgi:hypothetical protein
MHPLLWLMQKHFNATSVLEATSFFALRVKNEWNSLLMRLSLIKNVVKMQLAKRLQILVGTAQISSQILYLQGPYVRSRKTIVE